MSLVVNLQNKMFASDGDRGETEGGFLCCHAHPSMSDWITPGVGMRGSEESFDSQISLKNWRCWVFGIDRKRLIYSHKCIIWIFRHAKTLPSASTSNAGRKLEFYFHRQPGFFFGDAIQSGHRFFFYLFKTQRLTRPQKHHISTSKRRWGRDKLCILEFLCIEAGW